MALGVASGFFADVGLNVFMEEMPRTGDAMRKLIDGTTEFVVVGAVPVINAARAGHHPLIVMSIEADNVFAVMGSSSIRSPNDLKGKIIAISGRHEQDDIMVRRALAHWGIDPDNDVTFEARGSRGKCWDAIISGEAVAMCATIPQPILARANGLPVLMDFANLHEPYQAGSVVTTRAYADANSDTVTRFLEGQLRAVRQFQSDFELSLPHLKARSKLDDVEVLRETHRLFGEAAEDYIPNPAASATVLCNLAAAIGEPIDIDLDRIIDASFATALEGRKPYPSVGRAPST
jgi:ABC-type nitrate/sulfonate/bicarbonate transport system substrate-binding protein